MHTHCCSLGFILRLHCVISVAHLVRRAAQVNITDISSGQLTAGHECLYALYLGGCLPVFEGPCFAAGFEPLLKAACGFGFSGSQPLSLP